MPRNPNIVCNRGFCPQCKANPVVRVGFVGTMPRCKSCRDLNRKGRNERQAVARSQGLRLGHYNKDGVRYGLVAGYHRYLRSKLKRFGLTEEWWNNKEKQCEICHTDKPGRQDWSFDHDHSCCELGCPKCFRGVLCDSCNRGLGAFKDNEDSLSSAITYLSTARGNQPRAE